MKLSFRHLIFSGIFVVITLTTKAQSPCESCTEAFRATAIFLTNNFRQDLGNVMPFAGPNSDSYIYGDTRNDASETIISVGFLKGLYDFLKETKAGFWAFFGVAANTNMFISAADSFWIQTAGARSLYLSQMVTLENDFCNCLKSRDCANGCP